MPYKQAMLVFLLRVLNYTRFCYINTYHVTPQKYKHRSAAHTCDCVLGFHHFISWYLQAGSTQQSFTTQY